MMVSIIGRLISLCDPSLLKQGSLSLALSLGLPLTSPNLLFNTVIAAPSTMSEPTGLPPCLF